MSKRNFILLIIILVIIVIGVFWFLFAKQTPSTEEGTGEGINFGSMFNPFGPTKPATSPTTPPVDISGYQPEPTSEIVIKLKKISSMPIAGFAVFNKERLKEINPTPTLLEGEGAETPAKPTPPPTEFMPALRYVDRATGNIYQTFADKIEERRFSTTVIPKVYEAFFGNKGESVIMRYLKPDERRIETFVGNLPKELLGGDTTENNEIKGAFLPADVKDVSLSSDGENVFYLFNSENNIIGATLNLLTNKKTQIFDSPFTEWLSQWPNNKMITLTTKPSSLVPGYMYTMNSGGQNFNQVLGKINGLTTLTSPDGKLALYGDNNLSLSLYHTDTKTIEPLGARTLPEKCVWGKAGDTVYCAVPKSAGGGQYPDTWYQGEVSFDDQIWKIDIETKNATLVIDPVMIVGGEEIDGIKLAMDDGENYLFFVNKKDSFLWELALK